VKLKYHLKNSINYLKGFKSQSLEFFCKHYVFFSSECRRKAIFIIIIKLRFRVRKYIINLKAIADIISYSNSRLKIELKVENDEDIIVSREKVKCFKAWLEK